MASEPAEQWAFETFATAYPHEAHALDPDRFWAFFQRARPGVARAEMERALAETAGIETPTGETP